MSFYKLSAHQMSDILQHVKIIITIISNKEYIFLYIIVFIDVY